MCRNLGDTNAMKSAVVLVLLLGAQTQPPIRILNPTNPNPVPSDARMTQFDQDVKGVSWRVFAVDAHPGGPVAVTQVAEVRQQNPPSSWALNVTNRGLMPLQSVTMAAAVVDVKWQGQSDTTAAGAQEPEAWTRPAPRDEDSRHRHRADRSSGVLPEGTEKRAWRLERRRRRRRGTDQSRSGSPAGTVITRSRSSRSARGTVGRGQTPADRRPCRSATTDRTRPPFAALRGSRRHPRRGPAILTRRTSHPSG